MAGPFKILVTFLTILLSACGGGAGSGGDGPTPVIRQDQAELHFEYAEIAVESNHGHVTNPLSGGSGSGTISYSSSNTGVATVATGSGAVTVTGAGTATITATKAADESYHSTSASYLLTVSKIPQSPLLFGSEQLEKKVSDEPFTLTASGGAGTGEVTYSSENPQVATVELQSGRVTIIGAGLTTITAVKASDNKYEASAAQYSVTVSKIEQDWLSFENDHVSKLVIDPPFSNPVIGGSGTGTLRYSSEDPNVAAVETGTGVVTITGAGTTVIRAQKQGDGTYLSASAEYHITVHKAPQAPLTFETEHVSKVTTDQLFSIPLRGGSGSGLVSYTSTDHAVATINATTGEIFITGAGDAVIHAEKAGDSTYVSAVASLNLTVDRAAQSPLTFAQPEVSKKTTDLPFTNPVTGGSGLGSIVYTSSSPDVATVNHSNGHVTIIGAGSTVITAEKLGDATYMETSATYHLSVSKTEQSDLVFEQPTVARLITAEPFTNTVSGGSGTGNAAYSSSDLEVATVDSETGLVTVTGAGTSTITLEKEGDDRYLSASASFALTVAKVDQAALTFAQQEIIKSAIDEPFMIGLSGGSGTGALSYLSNDTSVATVDGASGEITLVGQGTATVTATKAADERYNETSANLSVQVLVPDGTLPHAAIAFPWQQSIVKDIPSITVRGTASDVSGIRSVSVNGVEASLTLIGDDRTWVEWQALIENAQTDLQVVVDATDMSGERATEADSIQFLRPTSVPTTFTLDESRQRVVGAVSSSEIVIHDLVNQTQESRQYWPYSVASCFDSATDSVYFAALTEDAHSFRRLSLSSDETSHIVHSQPRDSGYIRAIACDIARNRIYIHMMYFLEGTTESALYELSLNDASWTRFYPTDEGSATPFRIKDGPLASTGGSIIVVTADRDIVAISKSDGSARTLYESYPSYVLHIASGSTEDQLYLITFDGIDLLNVAEQRITQIGYEFDLGPLEFSQPRTSALDSTNNRVIVGDEALDALIAIDVDSGVRSVLLTESVGQGQKLLAPRGLAVNSTTTKTYIIDDGSNAAAKVVEIDFATGDRSVIGDISESYRETGGSIALDEQSGHVYVAGRDTVFKIDIESGTSEVIASDSVGLGAAFYSVADIEFDAPNRRLLFVDAHVEAVFALDLETHTRTIVSRSGERGAGDAFGNVNGLALDSINNRAYVTNQLYGTVQRVDLETGDREALAPSCAATLGEDQSLMGLAFDPTNNELLVIGDRLTAINLQDLQCSIVSYLQSPFDIAISSNDLVLAVTFGELQLMDRRSGRRVVISK
jgi:uncharacterized protein YjdB